MADLTFILLTILVIGSAVWVVTAPNLVHAAVALMGTLFGIAGYYVLLYADFLAATQVVIYVGGILVLIIFGVMLTQQEGPAAMIQTNLPNRFFAAIITLVLFAGLAKVLLYAPWHIGEYAEPSSSVELIGRSLLGRYLLHFEVASVLLLLALLGAAYLSRRENG